MKADIGLQMKRFVCIAALFGFLNVVNACSESRDSERC